MQLDDKWLIQNNAYNLTMLCTFNELSDHIITGLFWKWWYCIYLYISCLKSVLPIYPYLENYVLAHICR